MSTELLKLIEELKTPGYLEKTEKLNSDLRNCELETPMLYQICLNMLNLFEPPVSMLENNNDAQMGAIITLTVLIKGGMLPAFITDRGCIGLIMALIDNAPKFLTKEMINRLKKGD